ncbi:MAG: lytic transglycosylase domain-containing protein, partial [Armatimonadetes bacterium]|nr:lytic transglycosylase domain-containing protein [Armatimonadota bacterium]
IFAVSLFLIFLYYTPFIWRIFYPFPYKEIILKEAKRHKLDPLILISLIKAESDFKLNAKSKTGAIGLMQIMPKTAEDIVKELNFKGFSLEALESPELNVFFGAYYLSKLKKNYRGNLFLALAAYNGGSSNVDLWLKNKSAPIEIKDIPFLETRKYLKNIFKNYKFYKKAYSDL